MGCVESSNFVVLINGTPTTFFPCTRDIRQGCPLSPLLFILTIESLSLLVNQAHHDGLIQGIKVSSSLHLTHLLFVDDVLLFGVGTIEEWQHFKILLDLFCSATGMSISEAKSSFLYNEVDLNIKDNVAEIFPYKMEPLSEGFKYLGFYLKPMGYHSNDWHRLLNKFEKRISNWSYRLLSMGGQLILVKAVLTGLVVYWLTLARMPQSILNFLRCTIFNFLWGSSSGKSKNHLVHCHLTSRPYEMGGWNILNLE